MSEQAETPNRSQPSILPMDPYSTIHELTTFIKQERETINYAEIAQNSRVIALGEEHGVDGYLEEELIALGQLKTKGFTHVGMEMVLPSIQGLIDRYIQTGEGKDEIVQHLRDDWGYTPERYMDIIDAAKELGLKVVGIGMPKEEKDAIPDDLERERTSDAYMASAVERVLQENPLNKVITITGYAHAIKSQVSLTMASILMQDGITIVSARFSGGKIRRRKILNDLELAAERAHVRWYPFMLPAIVKFPESKNRPPVDWEIYVPQLLY